ncbi:hypothetical protein ACL03H_01465 [Saccharopolyspora sp. MS10]|uniref:hypothetical protein n=1 Tax=Saccharopolyspora sp. MS10 TaxID=3385973 RepID=UPI0039A0E117
MELDDALVRDIVEEGEEDYLDISTIAYLYKLEHDISREQLDPLATEIAAELIRRGLIIPGTLDNGFHPWNLTTEESVATLSRDVQLALRESPMLSPGQVCWFDITEKARREYPPTDAD